MWKNWGFEVKVWHFQRQSYKVLFKLPLFPLIIIVTGKTSIHRMVMHLIEKQVHDKFECTLFSLIWHTVRKSISWCYSVKRSPLYLVSVPADPPIQDSRSSHSLFHPEDDFYPQAGLNQKTDFSLSSWAEPPPQWPSSIHQELELSFLKM